MHTTTTSTTTTPTTPTTTRKTTTKSTTAKRTTTKSTTVWTPPTTSNLVTAAASDPHKNTATIVGVVAGVFILIALIAVSVVTVRRRNIQMPGLDTVRGLINPAYKRDDTGMVNINTQIKNILFLSISFKVSLRELSSRDPSA